jgi:hypothetical protein
MRPSVVCTHEHICTASVGTLYPERGIKVICTQSAIPVRNQIQPRVSEVLFGRVLLRINKPLPIFAHTI